MVVGVSRVELGHHVGAGVGVEEGSAVRQRGEHVGHRRQVGEVEDQLVDGVLGQIARRGHDHPHRFAHEPDPVVDQWTVVLELSGEVPQHRGPPHGLGPDLVRTEHQIGRDREPGAVEPVDGGVGRRAADHRRVQETGQFDVVDVATTPGESAAIVDPWDAATDEQTLARIIRQRPGQRARHDRASMSTHAARTAFRMLT